MSERGDVHADGSLAMAHWDDWLLTITDRLLSLEERAKTSGTDTDRADVNAAFVAFKAIAERLRQLGAAPVEQRDVLAAAPIIDALGGAVADNLNGASRLLSAIVDAVEARIGNVEQTVLAEAANQAKIAADLTVCERLANQLGTEVNVVAEIRQAMARGEDLNRLASRATELRRRLEHGEAERTRTFAAWPDVPARIAELNELRDRASNAAIECQNKIKGAPNLAIPAVDALDQPRPIEVLRAMPWAAARAHMQPLLAQIDRVRRALLEATERFEAPVRERGELRGLLQAFGRKAAATGGAEDPQLAPLYADAERALWTAPCDVVAGRDAVQRYIAAVNGRAAGST
ncbi:MAG TPA: hypothetical protein PKV27_09990, partial [Ilumatobacteraceae bacterium]|nr:hypothetical protein [Ilumatobacteraceae bacterium]